MRRHFRASAGLCLSGKSRYAYSKAHRRALTALLSLVAVGDPGESRVANLLEQLLADRGTPNLLQNLPVAVHGDEREIVLRHPGLAVLEEIIEHFVARAGACSCGAVDLYDVAEVGKLVSERKCPVGDPLANAFELLQRAAEIPLRRRSPHSGTVALPLEFEVELDPVLAFRPDAAGYRLSTHL